ncbi:hypothetical protein [Parafrankia sp. EUN1f]|uniref:hypothetical protein n=1 Tax=Parafrankia sp. EUN1f TaxID=102897 RepID=UPI0001C439DA|nr:hypothetical protein [Parafrankia sp. EUN1f]EFC85443.1 hypothetical protein FrEUN1fDRAFT_1430 [Parafrankia sp. EUN1f]
MRRTARPAPESSDTGHVTPSQLAYWRRSGLVRPGRGELTQARAVAALRRAGLSPRRIRAAAERLRVGADLGAGQQDVGIAAGRGTGAPARSARPGPVSLRFAVYGQELFVQRPGGAWEGDRAPGQLILDGIVPLVPVDTVLVGHLPGGIPPSSTPAGGGGKAGRSSGAAGGDREEGPARAGGIRPAGASASDQIRRFLGRQEALEHREH